MEFTVSILAHLEGWALPGTLVHPYLGTQVSILAHLEGWALRQLQATGESRH